jgi:hypothetical protein
MMPFPAKLTKLVRLIGQSPSPDRDGDLAQAHLQDLAVLRPAPVH